MKWFKYGCFGCLGVLGVLVLLLAVMGGMAWQRSGSMQAEEKVLTREIPSLPEAPEAPALPPGAIAADLPESADRLSGVTPGRVFLDLSHAEFRIERSEWGEPLRVEGNFDPDYYELQEEFDQGEDLGWTYRVSFRRKGGFSLVNALSEWFSGTSPEVRIVLPVDYPLDLNLRLRDGGTVANLGGLWLTSAEVGLARGGLVLTVSEPLRRPAEQVSIRGSMGGLVISRLGNASPRHLEVEHSMGGLVLDLRGQWIQDSEATINLSMGGGELRLPENMNIEGLDDEREGSRPEAEPGLPTLTITTLSEMGNLEFVD
jgi:hypothetical protein